MIDELQVSNIALIREATLVPSAGLTVLTGETGAGKTALLSALNLILGERADSSTVREGEALASVEARLFDGPHDTEGFTVQRSLSAEGRSRVKIDGRIASVRELSERVGVMMDLCGQHEHQRLLDPAHHVAMVDAWAGRLRSRRWMRTAPALRLRGCRQGGSTCRRGLACAGEPRRGGALCPRAHRRGRPQAG